MFIAMNRFRVVKGSEDAFENVWLSRDSHLDMVSGRRSHTLCLPQRMGEPDRVRGLDPVRGLSGRSPWGRREQAPIPGQGLLEARLPG